MKTTKSPPPKTDSPKPKPPICAHLDRSIVVLEIIANCEKTAIQCDYCGQILTEHKTDCR